MIEKTFRDECYSISQTSTNLFATMSEKRSFAASIAISETCFWITGGLHGPEGLKTSEYIENGVSRWVENSFRKQC